MTQLEYHKRQRVDISGQVVVANIASGGTIIGRISGQTVIAHISGQTVQVAGAVNISGQLVYTQRLAPTIIRTRPVLVVPSTSGGTQLQSGDVFRVTVENLHEPGVGGINGNIYLGSDDDPPYSGKGIVIVPGGSWTVETDNFYKIRVFAAASGAKVAYIGEQYASAVNASGHQVTVVMPGPISISGQYIYFVSGFNPVQNSGQIQYLTSGFNSVQNSGQVLYLVNDGVNNIVKISGQTVAISTETFNARVSGETVYLFSGRNAVQISGQTVATSISGQVVNALVSGGINVSGAAMKVSGETVIGKVSGETVYFASGQNAVQISGQDIGLIGASGRNGVYITNQAQSAAATVSTLGTAMSVASNILYTMAALAAYNGTHITRLFATESGSYDPGRLKVSVSGETVFIAGGVNVSGATVGISGQTVLALISGQPVDIAGQSILSKVSGETVIARISGETVVALISGQTVIIAGGITVSGSVVRLADINGSGLSSVAIGTQNALLVSVSGQPVTANVTVSNVSVSGAVVVTQRLAPSVLRTRPILSVGAASGGTALQSGDVFALTLQMLQGETGVLYVGSEDDPPYSGKGFVVYPGGAYSVETDNFNRVKVFATTSGAKVSYIGLQYSNVQQSGAPVNMIVHGPISLSGNVLYLVSGQNSVQISGQTVTVASGNTVSTSVSGNAVRISGETVNAIMMGSGANPVTYVQTQDARNWLGVAQAKKYRFKSYDTLPIGSASGGTALLSGDAQTVSVRNVGQSGTVMYLSISGDFPWVQSSQSGHGWQLMDGDALTIEIDNPAWLRVVSLTSGQNVAYAISNY